MSSALSPVSTGLLFLATAFASATAFAAAGDRDPTYGQLGRALIDASNTGVNLQPNRLIQQADGKTVIIGWTVSPSSVPQDFAVVRLDANGNLDPAFDGDGVAIVNIGSSDQGFGIVEQSDHKLVAVGVTSGSPCLSSRCISVVRLNADGTPDLSFGVGGTGKVVVTAAGAADSAGVEAAMQGSSIVIGGYKSTNDFIFIRLTNTGVLEPTFNGGVNGGINVVDMGDPMIMQRMTAQADGSFIAVGGSVSAAAPFSMGIARITGFGVLDPSFNGTGKLITSCSGPCAWMRIVQQPDQKLVFVASESVAPQGSPVLQQSRSIVERRNLDGSLDTSFGAGGRITNVLAGLDPHPISVGDLVSGIAVDSTTGNITVIGRTTSQTYASGVPTNTTVRNAIARYTPTGLADTTFGSGGLRMLPLGTGPDTDNYGANWFTLNLLPDGRTLVLGSGSRGSTDRAIAVARLSNGAGNPGLLSVTGFPVQENAGFAWVVVSRTAGSTGAISVSYATVSGTAVAGSDFVATNGTLSWADGDIRTKLIKIPLISDSVAESADETFEVKLSGATGGADIVSSGSVTIYRDDVAPANTITITSGPTEVFETSGSAVFVVSRTGTDPIAMNYTTAWDSSSGPVAQSPSDYVHTNGILVWGSGDTAPKTITIPIVNDGISEPAEELNLAFFLAGAGVVHTNSLKTVTIHNGPPPSISIAASVSVSENQSAAIVNLTRAGQTTATVSVSYTTASGTAIAGADFTTTTGTLTWLPGDPDVKPIAIPLLADTSIEANETFTVTLSNASGGATLGVSSSTVTITDDDTPAPPPPSTGGGGGANSMSWLFVLCGLLIMSEWRRSRLWSAERLIASQGSAKK
jgi:uncharacterized delta-60 repeat protein